MLPWSGGWLDWDHQETREQEWLEEAFEQERQAADRRRQAREAAAGFRGM